MIGREAGLVGVILSLLVLSALLTGWVRRWALVHRVLDLPNARSSHSTPTPRGGGLAIVVTVLVSIVALGAYGRLSVHLVALLVLCGAAVALIGLIDDTHHVTPRIRLTVHLAAASLFIGASPAPAPIDFGFGVYDLGVLAKIVGVLALVWLINLYNFMDGIDGIAGVEAISVSSIAALVLVVRTPASPLLWPLMSTAAAAGGFLLWNWPPAHIFMGDAGSGFLGFLLGALAWTASSSGTLDVWFWLIVLGAFFVDATVTLARRAMRGASLASAHRSHAYQRLSRRLGSHRAVTLGCLAINLLWLAPLAWLAAARPPWGGALLVIAWLPLAIGVWRVGAGTPD